MHQHLQYTLLAKMIDLHQTSLWSKITNHIEHWTLTGLHNIKYVRELHINCNSMNGYTTINRFRFHNRSTNQLTIGPRDCLHSPTTPLPRVYNENWMPDDETCQRIAHRAQFNELAHNNHRVWSQNSITVWDRQKSMNPPTRNNVCMQKFWKLARWV